MKNKYTYTLVILLLFIINILYSTDSYAVTASPNPIEYKQPDGSIVTIILKGDEFIHWAETPDGYTLLSNKSGAYEYAILSSEGKMGFSGIQAHNKSVRDQRELEFLSGISKGVFFTKAQIADMKQALRDNHAPAAALSGAFPTTGTRKLLVILANFSNTSTTYPQANFDNYMNQVNYNGTGSFKDYYLEVSYGQLTMVTTVTTWVTLPNTHDYYGPDTKWGEFALAAITAANNQTSINFADFDNDLDGVVDGVAIFHQGQGQEETASTNDIWSHSWDLISAGYSAALRTFDGVLVEAYTTMPERNASGMGTIGVMCHEFGHNLGSPDFYDTDYSTSGQYDGTGDWDLMAGGSWNGTSGDKPAHPNAYIKSKIYNWATASVISTAQNVTLRDIKTYKDIVQINTNTANEYFLCENRQLTGFNSTLPGHGMIIYHVDGSYIAAHEAAGDINAGSHQGLFPMSAVSTTASGIMLSSVNKINVSGCPWPGTSAKTTFTDATTPNAKSWASVNTAKSVINITESGGNITFCLIACDSNIPANLTATPVSSSQINLSWAKNSNSDPVMIAFNTTNTFGTPVDGTTYSAGGTIVGGGTVIYNGTSTTFNHNTLSANTIYYYKAWSVITGNVYSAGIIANATTLCSVLSLPFTEGFEASSNRPNCWTEENSNPAWLFIAGNGGTSPSTAHGGTKNACLKDASAASNLNKLITPVLDLSGYYSATLTFYLYMKLWSPDQDELKVYYRTSEAGTWVVLQSFTSSIASWTLETITLPNLTSTYQIGFEGNAKYGYGVCIDDVNISAVTPTWIGTSGTDWNTAANWVNNSVPASSHHINIPSAAISNFPVISTAVQCGNLQIQSGAILTVNPGGSLTVNGTLTNSAGTTGLVIKSDATGTGSLITNTAGVSATVERYLTGSTSSPLPWHLISPPVDGQSIPAFVSATSSLTQTGIKYGLAPYDNATPGWAHYTTSNVSGAGNFIAPKGYEVLLTANTTTSFAGTLAATNRTTPVTSPALPGNSWNLLGNPYSSAIYGNLPAVATNNFLDYNSGIFAPGYKAFYIWNPSTAAYSVINNVTVASFIPIGQSFFINSVSGGATATFIPAMRTHSTAAFNKGNESIWPSINLNAKIEDNSKTTQIIFIPGTSTGLDEGYDAGVFDAGNLDFSLCTKITGSKIDFAMQCLPESEYTQTIIPVGLIAPAGSVVTFSADKINIPENIQVYLEDKDAGTYTRLDQKGSTYTVKLYAESSGSGRFFIHTEQLTVGNTPQQENVYTVIPLPQQHKIHIIGNISPSSSVTLFDMNGRIVKTVALNSGFDNEIDFSPFSSGIYSVRIQNGNVIINRKISWVY